MDAWYILAKDAGESMESVRRWWGKSGGGSMALSQHRVQTSSDLWQTMLEGSRRRTYRDMRSSLES
jgi:hypothetical protein